jgi:outer membrane protein
MRLSSFPVLALASVCSLLALARPAAAQATAADDYQPHAGTLVLRLGGAGVLFNTDAKFRLAGQTVQGANAKLSNNGAPTFSVDYFLTRSISASLTVGVPPTTTATGTGTLAPLGELGSVQYGPSVTLVKYHVGGLGRIQPWVGAGVTRMLVFGNHDGAITHLKVHPSWGGAFQGGVEYMMDSHWGVYGGVTQLLLRTHAQGMAEGLPVAAEVALDPTIVEGGLSFRF